MRRYRANWKAIGMIHPQPKPEKIAKAKARKARTEAAVKKAVREKCVERDGRCRIGHDVIALSHQESAALWLVAGGCAGRSQFAHLPPHTLAHTRGLPPEERHDTSFCIMACLVHHDMIDGRRKPRLTIFCLTDKGADGPIQVSVK